MNKTLKVVYIFRKIFAEIYISCYLDSFHFDVAETRPNVNIAFFDCKQFGATN